jgi:hypothetical protein
MQNLYLSYKLFTKIEKVAVIILIIYRNIVLYNRKVIFLSSASISPICVCFLVKSQALTQPVVTTPISTQSFQRNLATYELTFNKLN